MLLVTTSTRTVCGGVWSGWESVFRQFLFLRKFCVGVEEIVVDLGMGMNWYLIIVREHSSYNLQDVNLPYWSSYYLCYVSMSLCPTIQLPEELAKQKSNNPSPSSQITFHNLSLFAHPGSFSFQTEQKAQPSNQIREDHKVESEFKEKGYRSHHQWPP